MTTRITTENITDATIITADLASSVTGKLNVQWQAVKTSDFTAVAGEGYFVNTASAEVDVTLPASPSIGDTVAIVDYGANSATNNIILVGNGSKILGSSVNKTISTNEVGIALVYTDSTKGWVVTGAYIEGTIGLVGVPGAPTIGTAVLNGSDIDVPFTAPTDNGDNTITSYTATSSPDGVTGTLSQAGSGTITVTGLSTGTSYTFTVTATNGIGTSAASAASNSVTTPSPSFIAATGGTVTTVATDFKVHIFTGDGCFVVSTAGNPVGCAGGPSDVDYMIVAGGGAGGDGIGGGGGGGGFRESHSCAVSGPYTASPLATPTALTVTATTYPISVGAGGAVTSTPGCQPGRKGSDSVFSTITSAGGGGGGSPNDPYRNGGSGGGSGHRGGAGGTGNTPPVSPPQGNNAGASPAPVGFGGSGGGGASGTGGAPTSPQDGFGGNGKGGPGGAGTTSSISGSSLGYSGGGGGGGYQGPGGAGTGDSPGGSGGGGNGGSGGGTSNPGQAGGTNQGGGGGGKGQTYPGTGSGNGGTGVVIIRYKFQ